MTKILSELVSGRGTADEAVVEGCGGEAVAGATDPSVSAARCHLPEQARRGT